MATFCVDNGLDITTARLRGVGTEPNHIGWGTGTQTTTTRADTGLGPTTVERDVDLTATTGNRTTGTSSQVTTSTTDDTYQVVGTRTATASGTVTCAGLFDNVTIGSGGMYMKGDFVGIGLANGDAIQFTCKVQYDN